jgi:hypothetical protein
MFHGQHLHDYQGNAVHDFADVTALTGCLGIDVVCNIQVQQNWSTISQYGLAMQPEGLTYNKIVR